LFIAAVAKIPALFTLLVVAHRLFKPYPAAIDAPFFPVISFLTFRHFHLNK